MTNSPCSSAFAFATLIALTAASDRSLLTRRLSGTSPGNGISKNTYSVSDPLSAFSWMKKYLPVHCTDSMLCDKQTSCGAVGRASFCLSKACTEDGMSSFGIHTVNTSHRPDGGFPRATLEDAYNNGLQKAFSLQKYDHYMDFATVLFAVDLDMYISKFSAASVDYLLLSWKDEVNTQHYSVIVHVPNTQIVFELVSNTKPRMGKSPVADALVRLPSSVFNDNPTSSASSSILVPLAVSKAVPSVDEVNEFYSNVLFAHSYYNTSAGDAKATFIKMVSSTVRAGFPPSGGGKQTMALRFVERPESATFGPMSIKTIQDKKVSAQKATNVNAICGVSIWHDNHWAFDSLTVSLDSIKAKLDDRNWPYQIWGAPLSNMYAVDSTGDSIQLDGSWTSCSICSKASGDALMSMCSQGNCNSEVVV